MYNPRKKIKDKFKEIDNYTKKFEEAINENDLSKIKNYDIPLWHNTTNELGNNVIPKSLTIEYQQFKAFKNIYLNNLKNPIKVLPELLEHYNKIYPIIRRRYRDLLNNEIK